MCNKGAHLWNENENTYNALQICNTMTTVYNSFSVSNYDKSGQFEAQLKFKFSVNSICQILSQSDTPQVNVSTVPSHSP
jgi:hypothetical protein